MKIIQVITRSDTIGGAQRHVLELSNYLRCSGHSVSVYYGGSGILVNKLEGLGISSKNIRGLGRSISLLGDINALIQLRRALKAECPDIVALHSVKAGLIGRIAALGLPAKVVYTAHGWSHIRNSKGFSGFLYRRLERLLALRSDVVICVSNTDFDYAHEEISISTDRLTVIKNGVKESGISGQGAIGKSQSLNLLSITRFQPPKDFDTLARALVGISQYNWELTLAGDGQDIANAKQLVERLGLDDRVHFLGFVDDLSPLFEKSDAVVLASRSEGLPLALLEAMSWGKPIVASAVGGIPEIVETGKSGFLVESGNVQQLQMALKSLIDLKENGKIDDFGKESLRLYESSYRLDGMLSKTERLYKRLVCRSY